MTAKKASTNYSPTEIEKKWQAVWRNEKVFSPDLGGTNTSTSLRARRPYYNLMMFPYPSAEGLHAGNMYAFTGADIWGRYQRMKGNDVFEPMGLDGFGIHSENYAIKIGEHPVEVSKRTEERFYAQLQATGNSFDWTRTLETYDPDYYRWTQWIFVQMFKQGLAYRAKARVNWCPSCLTVLADEQVVSGMCERCGTSVEQKDLEQWFFKITDYADRLLANLAKIDWTEKIKIAQKNWIGRSEGASIRFVIARNNHDEAISDRHAETVSVRDDIIEVFTTRPDTLYGTTFMVIAPDSPLVDRLTTKEQKQAVSRYIKTVQPASQNERVKDKTGVFTGASVINPANNKKVPVYISNYVVSGYGSEAVMGVPAHDERDFEFAKKYKLPVVQVIGEFGKSGNRVISESGNQLESAYVDAGEIINSGDWDEFKYPEDFNNILDSLEERGWGKRKTTYHLRDWLISRQRYWGPPIPMIYCDKCVKENKGEREDMPGWYSVPEKDLPVELPYVENYRPTGTGKSPLAQEETFVNVACPKCGEQARRETDVSDTFLDSAWYFLRYPSLGLETANSKPFDQEITKKWLPVHMYIGGAEHSVLHLMYSRFITMALHDWGHIEFEEPFTRFYAHGLLIREGAKMSKSKGNIIVPDVYIAKYGADTLRSYLMFLSPFDQGGDFRDTGMEGMFKFVRRVWDFVWETRDLVLVEAEDSKEVYSQIHKTIKRVTEDLENLRYNRALAGIMEFVNFLKDVSLRPTKRAGRGIKCAEWEQALETLLKLFAPFAPHMTEELWQELQLSVVSKSGKQKTDNWSIHFQPWPKYDPVLVVDELVTIPVQVNGKLRGTVQVSSGDAGDQVMVEEKARELKSARSHLEGLTLKKVIFVPGRLVNFVV